MNDSPDSPVAAWVAGLLLPVAVWLAFWVIDFDGMIVGQVGFCVIVPSVVGSTVAALVNAARRP